MVTSKDLKVNKVKYEKVGTNIQFTIEIESGKVRGYSFFNPPNGKKNMTSGIKKGKTSLKLKVPIAKTKKFDSLTFKMIDNKKLEDYIFIYTDKLKY